MLACRRRLCCGRKPTLRPANPPDKEPSSQWVAEEHSSSDSRVNDPARSPVGEATVPPVEVYREQIDIDLDRLTMEYLDAINEYRLQLELLPLELSDELTHRALERAAQLSMQAHTDVTNRWDLLYNNEPLGET